MSSPIRCTSLVSLGHRAPRPSDACAPQLRATGAGGTDRTPRLRFIAAAIAAAALTLTCAFAPHAALADEPAGSAAAPATATATTTATDAAGAATIPCAPTADQLAAYEADGSLATRQAFQEQLGNDQPSAGLIQHAIAQQNAADGIAASAVPSMWESGMGYEGRAHVLALRVSFPDMQFAEGDTLEALQALIGPKAPGEAAGSGSSEFPYESLSGYYYRSSYGTLTITGEAIDYQAKHERDYYTGDVSALFKEALAALDETEDLSRFDANGDNKIDAVYLHFAGSDTGWGSTWWSNETSYRGDDAWYDEGTVRLWNYVTLAAPSNDAWSANTLIHETGHVLGLPDYYSYAGQSGGTDNGGILTFDMMMGNQGDHNGFSKWMLGWVGADDVTRIVANSRETVVKRGGEEIARLAAGEPVEQTIAAFTSDNAPETGGIIVLSNEDEGIFSSYYVLQYDRFAGNQRVHYHANDGSRQLPSGFRMFRVQAALNDDGSDFVTTNSYGGVHNKLIELVDPDGNELHSTFGTDILCATDTDTYGCMLYEGSEVTPVGFPTTNFFESASVGFTGLSVQVTSADADRGTVRVSWSDEHQPEVPENFTITPSFDALTNAGTLTFTTSSQVTIPTGAVSPARLVVDGVETPLFDTTVTGTTITIPLALDPVHIKPDSTCEIVFPAGMFVLMKVGDETIMSPEVRVPLTPDAALAAVEGDGTWAGTQYPSGTPLISNIVATSTGERAFFQLTNGTLKLHTIEARDASRVRTVSIDGVDASAASAYQPIQALALQGDTLFVALPQYSDSLLLWIDQRTGDVLAKLTQPNLSGVQFVTDGTTVVATSAYYGTGIDSGSNGMLLTAMTPTAAGEVELHYGWTGEMSPISMGAEAFAFGTIVDDGGFAKTTDIHVVTASNLVKRLLESTYSVEDSARGGDLCGADAADAMLPFNERRILLAADATSDGYALLFGQQTDEASEPNSLVVRVDSAGKETGRMIATVGKGNDGSAFTQIIAGEHDTLALVASTTMTTGTGRTAGVQIARFLDAQLTSAKTLTTGGPGAGTWLADGRWVSAGTSLSAASGPVGSPLNESASNDDEETAVGATNNAESSADAASPEEGEPWWPKLHYTVTEPLDVAEPVDPEEPDTPEKPEEPTDPEQPEGLETDDPDNEGDAGNEKDSGTNSGPNDQVKPLPGGLAATGDATAGIAAALSAATLASLAIAIAARARSRTR